MRLPQLKMEMWKTCLHYQWR